MNKIKFPVIKKYSNVPAKTKLLAENDPLPVIYKTAKCSIENKKPSVSLITLKGFCSLCLKIKEPDSFQKYHHEAKNDEKFVNCVNCSKIIHFDCLMSITKILGAISEQKEQNVINFINSAIITNCNNNVVDNWTCFECRFSEVIFFLFFKIIFWLIINRFYYFDL